MFALNKDRMRLWDGTQHRRRSAWCMWLALSLVAMLCGEASAQPNMITSNTSVLLDATLSDGLTGEDVQLMGLIHVQTKVNLRQDTLGVHANIREESFLAFVQDELAPSDPRLGELRDRIRALQTEIVAVKHEVLQAMAELEEARKTDTNPFLPGIQIDKQRVAELERRLQQLAAHLEQLKQELSDLLDEMQDLLEELDESDVEGGDPITLYSALGADGIKPSPCNDLFCERLVIFNLIRADGERSPIGVLLRLQFSQAGELIVADAVLDEVPTDSETVDDT